MEKSHEESWVAERRKNTRHWPNIKIESIYKSKKKMNLNSIEATENLSVLSQTTFKMHGKVFVIK